MIKPIEKNDLPTCLGILHRGYGKELLDFCKQKAKELGAGKIKFGMIDDNKRLRSWYEANGFINVRYIKYKNAPYTVGKMECAV